MNEEESDGGELRELIRALWRRKWVVLATGVIGVLLTIAVLSRMTPLYTAHATLLIQSKQSNIVDFESVVTGLSADSATIQTQVEVLRSRRLAQRVIDQLGLAADPEFNPTLRPPRFGFVINAVRSTLGEGVAAMLTGDGDDGLSMAQRDELMRAAVIDAFLNKLEVRPVPNTYVLDVSITSANAEKATLVTNTLVETYIDEQLEAKFEATERANAWLNERLASLRAEVEASEQAVADFRAQNNLGQVNNLSVVEQQLQDLNSQLIIARSDRAATEARLQQLRSLLNSNGADTAAEVLQNPLIQNLREREAELQRELAELSTRYGDRHPTIINTRAEVEDIQRSIRGEVDKIVQNMVNEVQVARAREQSLQDSMDGLEGSLNDQNSLEVQLNRLEREASASREIFETMLSRYKQTSQEEEIQEPDARVLSAAQVPNDPSFPRMQIIIPLSVVVSLGLGLALAFLLDRLDSGFGDLEQAERTLGIPGLASVPVIRGGKRARPPEQIFRNVNSHFTESIRTLWTAVLLDRIDDPPRLIAVSSSVPAEGKSSVAASLASLVATLGKRTLLIDGDLRRPQAHNMLNLKRGAGLTDVLLSEVELADAVQIDERSGLHVLTAGKDVPNPHSILQSQALRNLLERLKGEYDAIILDTPALLVVTDARLLANLADRTILVAKWHATPRDVTLSTLRRLRESGAKVAGVALSQVNLRRQAHYGYGSYGYYYGRYRNYYTK